MRCFGGVPDVSMFTFFPAKNGKGIPNSPTVVEEFAGETRADALLELKKELIETDEANM